MGDGEGLGVRTTASPYDRDETLFVARAAAAPVNAAVAVAEPGAVRFATNCIGAGFSASARASAALAAQMKRSRPK